MHTQPARRIHAALIVAIATVLTTGAAAQKSPLAGTSWQLVRIKTVDEKMIGAADREKYTLALGADGKVSVRVDCNRGVGTWHSADSNFVFGPIAMTRAACPPGSLFERVVGDLGYVRSYAVKQKRLFLTLLGNRGVYEFEPLTVHQP